MQIIFVLILAGALLAMKTKYSFIPYAREIISESSKYLIPSSLALAQVSIESNFNPSAIGDNGTSHGLMQVSQAALHDVNVALGTSFTVTDLHNPAINTKVGMKYLDMKRTQYGGSLYKAYVAYNAGHYPSIAGQMYADSIYALSTEF